MASDASSRPRQLTWKAVSTLSAIGGGMAARKVIQSLWTSLADTPPEPPLNPADRRVGWSQALEWTVAAGVGVGVARLVSQRAAAAGWERATGSPPPGVTA